MRQTCWAGGIIATAFGHTADARQPILRNSLLQLRTRCQHSKVHGQKAWNCKHMELQAQICNMVHFDNAVYNRVAAATLVNTRSQRARSEARYGYRQSTNAFSPRT